MKIALIHQDPLFIDKFKTTLEKCFSQKSLEFSVYETVSKYTQTKLLEPVVIANSWIDGSTSGIQLSRFIKKYDPKIKLILLSPKLSISKEDKISDADLCVEIAGDAIPSLLKIVKLLDSIE